MSDLPIFLFPQALAASLFAIPVFWTVWKSGKYVSYVRNPGERTFGSGGAFRFVRAAAGAIAVLSAAAILADPRYERTVSERKTEGIDIAFVLDLSKSMLAEDILPNRLEVAKRVIAEFVAKREGDRFGLVAFAGKPFLLSPASPSKTAFSEILLRTTTDSIRQEIPGLSGTAMGDGLLLATDALSGSVREKVAIVLTDGEANVGLDPEPVAKYAAERGIRIFTVGIGDPKGTDLFVTDAATGQKRFFTGPDGKPIRAIVDEPLLRGMAETGSGEYGLAKDAESLARVFDRIDRLTKTETVSVVETRYPPATWPFSVLFCASFATFAFLRPKGAENQPA